MAVRMDVDFDAIKIRVLLKNGDVVGPFDTTNKPFSEMESGVSVWIDKNVLAYYPMSEVERVDLCFGGDA